MAQDKVKAPPTCRRCGRPIGFVLTEKGRYVPVEVDRMKLCGTDGNFEDVYVPHRDYCIGDEDRGDERNTQGSFA